MTFFGKAFAALTGLGIAGIGILAIVTLMDWPRETTGDLAWLFLLGPCAAMLTLFGVYIAWRGLMAGPVYISPTGTGETGPDK